jgi:hypothetical protein
LVLGPDVEVQAVLAGLGLGHLDEQQVGHHAVLATALGWLDDPLRILVLADHPVQRLGPEPGQQAGIPGVDDQCTDSQSHPLTVETPAADRRPVSATP